MSNGQQGREPGKRVYPSRVVRPKLVLVPPQEPIRPNVKTEFSSEVKEMLREMNRRHADTRKIDADTPDAA